MKKPIVTEARLTEALEKLRDQIAAIGKIGMALEQIERKGSLPAYATFEVYLKTYDPAHTSIKTEKQLLKEAFDEARELWGEYNGTCSRPLPPRAEVFLRTTSFRVVLDPEDVSQMGNAQSGAGTFSPEMFSVDPRSFEQKGKAVWHIEEDLPGWHAKKNTPHRTCAAAA